MDVNVPINPISNKAINFFSYLREFVQQRSKTTYDIENYEDVVWLKDIPIEPECRCSLWDDVSTQSDVWIEIKKPKEPKCPKPPAICDQWYETKDLYKITEEPKLKETITVDSSDKTRSDQPEQRKLNLLDNIAVWESWEKYIDESWKPWTQQYKRWQKIQTIYEKLFHMYQQQKSLGESFEVVVGMGFLQWVAPSHQKIRRHIVTAVANIEFEMNTGRITVSEPLSGPQIQLEDDMLNPTDRPHPDQKQTIENIFPNFGDDIWDKTLAFSIIKSWIQSLSSKGEFDEALSYSDQISEKPLAAYAPALILRKRGERSFLKAYSLILDAIKKGESIPKAVRLFLEISEDKFDSALGSETSKGYSPPTPHFFPLSFNDEQEKILSHLDNNNCVLVQGPPGTGKTHTIANLICHLLATGKRVLVTSQAPRALKVLKNKLPPQVSNLCISVLGNDIGSLKDLDDSIQHLTSKYYEWDVSKSDKRINQLDNNLAANKREMADLQSRLRELREKDSRKFTIIDNRYSGTAQSLAKIIAQESSMYSWLEDSISTEIGLPISRGEFYELLRLYGEISKENETLLNKNTLDRNTIPDEKNILELFQKEDLYKRNISTVVTTQNNKYFAALQSASIEVRKNLYNAAIELRAYTEGVSKRPLCWIQKAITDILTNQDRPWHELKESTFHLLDGLRVLIKELQDVHVTNLSKLGGYKLKADVEDRLKYFEGNNTKNIFRLLKKHVRKTEYIAKLILINGRNCESVKLLDVLNQWLEAEQRLENLWALWAPYQSRINAQPIIQAGELEECYEALSQIIDIQDKLKLSKSIIGGVVGLPEPAWHNPQEVGELLLAIQRVDAESYCKELQISFTEILNSICIISSGLHSHPINQKFTEALQNRDSSQWMALLQELSCIENQRVKLSRRYQLEKSLVVHAPKLTEKLRSSFQEACWTELLENIEHAWNHKRAESWLENYERDHNEEEIKAKLFESESKATAIIKELCAEKAWSFCFKRMTEEQRQNLMAWTQAIKRIGKGTGKRADKHRRDAQSKMEICRGAIPAWVMPLYRVAESISPKSEIFDVVIVDEASQCGPDALFLLYLGKQLIIVGDDQQISPEHVGIERNEVDSLINRYLNDIPHPESLGLEESDLFSQGVIRFGGRIVLREHFRCMPEIIRFSNDLCYKATPLKPLRQYPPKRLVPIFTQYVRDGYVEGSVSQIQNEPEAMAIVNDIIKCSADPEYENKSFGVIALQGHNQAKLIEQRLLKELGSQEFEKRNIVCGDPYAFQGDERDVVFLSLVAANNHMHQPLTKASDKRRFNVAASRARDQLRLYHSVAPEDLNTEDMRYKLLYYCLNYERPRDSASFDFEMCESDFERKVAEMILNHNYRVIPQYAEAGKRIDLVVEGTQGRLAIECDGDEWHGPDQYDEDMARQKMLERCGWVFWRVRGTDFYRNPEKTMESLWETLDEMNIYPCDHIPPTKENFSKQKNGLPEDSHNLENDDEENQTDEVTDDLLMEEEGDNSTLESAQNKISRKTLLESILTSLKSGSKGKDLISNEILRSLGVRARGENRNKYKRRILAILGELKKEGTIQEYRTAKRIRVKLNSEAQSHTS